MKRCFRLLLLFFSSLGICQEKPRAMRVFSDQLMAKTTVAWKDQLPLNIVHTTGNTLTAIQALLHDKADIIAVVRPLQPEERRQYRFVNGHAPLSIPIGLDAIGIYAHPDSSVHSLSLPQIRELFSNPGVCGPSPSPPLPPHKTVCGLKPVNGGYQLFSRLALCGARLKPQVSLLAEDNHILQTVARQHQALGFASASLALTANVRLIAIRSKSGRPVFPTGSNLDQGRYPLTHYLYLHFRPGGKSRMDFVRLALSEKGQRVLVQQGFVSLNPAWIKRLLQDLPHLMNR